MANATRRVPKGEVRKDGVDAVWGNIQVQHKAGSASSSSSSSVSGSSESEEKYREKREQYQRDAVVHFAEGDTKVRKGSDKEESRPEDILLADMKRGCQDYQRLLARIKQLEVGESRHVGLDLLTTLYTELEAAKKRLFERFTALATQAPRTCLSRKQESLVWKLVYQDVHNYVKAHARAKKRVEALSGNRAVPASALRKQRTAVRVSASRLGKKLDDCVALYQAFVDALEAQIGMIRGAIRSLQEELGSVSDSEEEHDMDDSPEPRRPVRSPRQRGAFHDEHKAQIDGLNKKISEYKQLECSAFACIGDFYRYAEKYLKSPEDCDWDRANEAYNKALDAFAGLGKIYNNLAVMAMVSQDDLAAMYYFIRALAAPIKFPAQDNFLGCIEKNRQEFDSMTKIQTDRKEPDAILEELKTRFCRLQGMLFSRVDTEKLPYLCHRFLVDLQLLLEDEAVSPRLLMQMVTGLIFLTHWSYNKHILQLHKAPKSENLSDCSKHRAAVLQAIESEERREKKEETKKSLSKLKSEHPFGTLETLDPFGVKSLELLLDITGYAIQEIGYSMKKLQFLPIVVVVSTWLSKYPLLVSENESDSARFFTRGLVQIANTIVFCSFAGFGVMDADFGRDFDAAEASRLMREWRGFVYLDRIRRIHRLLHRDRVASLEELSNPMLQASKVLLGCDQERMGTFASPRLRSKTRLSLRPGKAADTTRLDAFLQDLVAAKRKSAKKTRRSAPRNKRGVIMVDGVSVALSYALPERAFRVEGILKCLQYFLSRDCLVAVAVPSYCLDYSLINADADCLPTPMPDNVHLLNKLKEERLLFPVPRDVGFVEYVRDQWPECTAVASNDKYRDALFKTWDCPECKLVNEAREQFCVTCQSRRPMVSIDESRETKEKRRTLRLWLRAKAMTFAFIRKNFVPNPDFGLNAG